MYTIYNWENKARKTYKKNVSYCSVRLMSGLVKVEHKSSLKSL